MSAPWAADHSPHAKATANLYSSIETAKTDGIEPYRYLRHAFTDLPKASSLEDPDALLPHRTHKMDQELQLRLATIFLGFKRFSRLYW